MLRYRVRDTERRLYIKIIYKLSIGEVNNLDFSSLVLVERDKKTNNIINELGSYQVSEAAKYITKFYYDGDIVHLFFDTGRDVEEWEFTAIFDLFDPGPLTREGYEVEDVDDEYNPTWHITFQYDEDHESFQNKLNHLCSLIGECIDKVFEEIKGKEADYIGKIH